MSYQTRMTRTRYFALFALILGACDTPETLPFVPSEAGPPVIDMSVDSQPPQDMAPSPDAGPIQDAAPPDNQGPCGLPEMLPPMGSLTVIGGGEVSYLVWFQPRVEGGNDGALIAQRVELRRRATTPVPEGDAGVPAGEEEITIVAELAPPRAVRCLTDFTGELQGARLPGVAAEQSAWALVSEGIGPWIAVDVTGRTDEVSLGLYGPVRMAQRFGLGTDPDTVLIVGRTGADATAAVGLRALGGFGSQSPNFLRRGIPLPVAIAATGADWTFAFADGTCLLLDDTAGVPSQEFGEETLAGLGAWMCMSREGDAFVGSGALDSTVNALYLARPDNTGGVSLRAVRPGLNHEIPVTAFMADADGNDNEMEPAPEQNDAGPADAGARDAGVEAPPSAETTSPILINSIPEGVALRLGTDASPVVAVADENGLHILEPPTSPVGVLSGPLSTVFTVHVENNLPVVIPGNWAETQPSTPADDVASCLNRSPERCDDVDHDCDGSPRAGTCCRDAEELDWIYRLKAGQLPARDTYLTYALNDREQQIITLAEEVRLLDRGGAMSSVCAVCWPGEMRVQMTASQGRTVALAVALDSLDSETCPDDAVVPCRAESSPFVPDPTMAAPYEALAIYERRTVDEEEPARFLASPCQGDEHIKRLEVHEDQQGRFIPEAEMGADDAPPVYFMRVFCETMWFDLPFDGSPPIAQLYTDIEGIDGDVDVDWLGAPRYDGDGALFLARRRLGDGSEQMDVWRSRNPTDAQPTSLAVVNPPAWLATMSDEDTTLPFQFPAEGFLPARTVTVSDSGSTASLIERYEAGLGWTRLPTTLWPIDAQITPDGTMAVAAAHLVAPTADNLDAQRVGVFLHDLREGTSGWGRQIDASVIKFNGYHGISFFPRGEAPNYAILGTGEVGQAGRVSYSPVEISCTPPQ